ncbi:39S ribosomal protein L4, mitochondrial [Amphibalanus amphitrite]|uniref:Large ribosomal subunit protein uL4m n=1 Tax=Amphibalanus amphitrite TaxID=1232801 RepID=A0A6A4VGA6_AMPAM|nr:39S ribosomal protein L4, mitochondrial [Amphibalanus amphitrite]
MRLVNSRLARTVEELADYDFEICYVPGSLNSAADFFSRTLLQDAEVESPPHGPDLPSGLSHWYKPEGGGDTMVECLQYWIRAHRHRDISNASLRQELLDEAVRTPSKYDIKLDKHSRQDLRLMRLPGQLMAIDMLSVFASRYNVRIIVHFGSQNPLVFRRRGKEDAQDDPDTVHLQCLAGVHFNLLQETPEFAGDGTVLLAQVEEDYRDEPKRVLTDNGPEFCGPEFEKVLVNWGINHVYSTPLRPEGNGAVERCNRSLSQALRLLSDSAADWDGQLARALVTYNTTRHSELKESPAEFLLQRKHGGVSGPIVSSEIQNSWKPGHPEFTPFRVGELVKKEAHHPGNMLVNKFQRRYDGPFVVTRVNNNGVTYIVKSEDGQEKRVHHSQLRPWKKPPAYLLRSGRCMQDLISVAPDPSLQETSAVDSAERSQDASRMSPPPPLESPRPGAGAVAEASPVASTTPPPPSSSAGIHSSRLMTDAATAVPVAAAESDAPALLKPLTETVAPSAAAVRQVWVENMDSADERKLGLLELHPEVFAAFPKLHLIHDNVRWQRMYRQVDYAATKTRAEVRGGGRKPHPQKGGGRARAGSIRSPLWKGGGVSHGPRGPKTHFYMLSHSARVGGLCATLSVKLAQNDLHVVRDLELPSADPGLLQELVERRYWGPSVLFVDDTDEMPENLVRAADQVPHYNLLPVYGLNVFTMLKHDTLVLTVAAVERVQERLLRALSIHNSMAVKHTDASLLR